MNRLITVLVLALTLFGLLIYSPLFSVAQEVINIQAIPARRSVNIFVEPPNQTIIEGSTFDASFYINTNGNNINTIELNIKFSPDKLSVIKPSGSKSLLGIWLEPPRYSNIDGTARFVGIIPNGITTESGLITTITFKAINTGQATVSVLKNSRVLANDGLGTEIPIEVKRGNYLIVPKSPEGPKVFSETHPFSEKWYNNNNPVLAWGKDEGVTDFSYELDNKPFTIPDNNPELGDNIKSYENLPDSLWYFHIKAKRKGVWGSATHFVLRIDTTPPASFTPKIEFLTAMIINRALVNFFTTDTLSGINHYEVGIIEKDKSPLESPAFVQTESPHQLPRLSFENIRVIVRAVDNAGNVRDESVDVESLHGEGITSVLAYIKKINIVWLLVGLLVFLTAAFIIHYRKAYPK